MGSSAMSAADPKQIAQQSFLRTKDLSLTSAEADGLSSFSPKLSDSNSPSVVQPMTPTHESSSRPVELTPKKLGGILRPVATPGTGNTVRFWKRLYDDGDESRLTISSTSTPKRELSSSKGAHAARQSALVGRSAVTDSSHGAGQASGASHLGADRLDRIHLSSPPLAWLRNTAVADLESDTSSNLQLPDIDDNSISSLGAHSLLFARDGQTIKNSAGPTSSPPLLTTLFDGDERSFSEECMSLTESFLQREVKKMQWAIDHGSKPLTPKVLGDKWEQVVSTPRPVRVPSTDGKTEEVEEGEEEEIEEKEVEEGERGTRKSEKEDSRGSDIIDGNISIHHSDIGCVDSGCVDSFEQHETDIATIGAILTRLDFTNAEQRRALIKRTIDAGEAAEWTTRLMGEERTAAGRARAQAEAILAMLDRHKAEVEWEEETARAKKAARDLEINAAVADLLTATMADLELEVMPNLSQTMTTTIADIAGAQRQAAEMAELREELAQERTDRWQLETELSFERKVQGDLDFDLARLKEELAHERSLLHHGSWREQEGAHDHLAKAERSRLVEEADKELTSNHGDERHAQGRFEEAEAALTLERRRAGELEGDVARLADNCADYEIALSAKQMEINLLRRRLRTVRTAAQSSKASGSTEYPENDPRPRAFELLKGRRLQSAMRDEVEEEEEGEGESESPFRLSQSRSRRPRQSDVRSDTMTLGNYSYNSSPPGASSASEAHPHPRTWRATTSSLF